MSVNKFLKAAKDLQDEAQRPRDTPKHAASHDDGEGNWLISYADMMTLLCGFFIMLFSMAKMDEPKYEALKESLAKQFGGKYQNPTEELKNTLQAVVKQSGIENEAVITSDPTGVTVAFASTLFFDTLSAELNNEGRKILEKLALSVAERQTTENKKYKIVIEGHTDARPVLSGNYPSNWELSSARATRVVRLFLSNQFKGEQLTAIGYSDTYPVAESRNPDGSWNDLNLSKNRRVVVKIFEPRVESMPFPEGQKREPASTSPQSTQAAPQTGPQATSQSISQPSAAANISSPANSAAPASSAH